MATLPTIEVTQDQADTILAAYGGEAGYQAWLNNAVVDYVQGRESVRINAETAAEARARVEAFTAALPGRRPFTPPVPENVPGRPQSPLGPRLSEVEPRTPEA